MHKPEHVATRQPYSTKIESNAAPQHQAINLPDQGKLFLRICAIFWSIFIWTQITWLLCMEEAPLGDRLPAHVWCTRILVKIIWQEHLFTGTSGQCYKAASQSSLENAKNTAALPKGAQWQYWRAATIKCPSSKRTWLGHAMSKICVGGIQE